LIDDFDDDLADFAPRLLSVQASELRRIDELK
jgi:hypothetical protein